MDEIKVLRVANQLIGMPVISPGSLRKLGQVTDAVVHPTEGRVLGLVLRSLKDEECLLRADDIFIFGTSRAVLVESDSLNLSEDFEDSLRGGVRVRRDLIGASVITDAGELLGSVGDVCIVEEHLLTVYRVKGSRLREILRGGFFLAGNVPRAWSRMGSRLIVPASAQHDHAASSLAAAIKALEQEPAFTGNQS